MTDCTNTKSTFCVSVRSRSIVNPSLRSLISFQVSNGGDRRIGPTAHLVRGACDHGVAVSKDLHRCRGRRAIGGIRGACHSPAKQPMPLPHGSRRGLALFPTEFGATLGVALLERLARPGHLSHRVDIRVV